MREIKFRGRNRNGWHYGLLTKMFGQYAIVNTNNENDIYLIDKETICQYTDLKNKNNIEIYEGDILGFCDFDSLRTGGNTSDKMHTAVVKFSEGSWVVEDGGYCDYLYQVIANDSELEIIGNIYENPESMSV